MNNLTARLIELIYVKEDLVEALELIEMSRKVFQQKLKEIKKQAMEVCDQKQRQQLLDDAQKLYQQYQETLQFLEDYISERGQAQL